MGTRERIFFKTNYPRLSYVAVYNKMYFYSMNVMCTTDRIDYQKVPIKFCGYDVPVYVDNLSTIIGNIVVVITVNKNYNYYNYNNNNNIVVYFNTFDHEYTTRYNRKAPLLPTNVIYFVVRPSLLRTL